MIYILVPLLILADQLTKIWSFNKFTPGVPEQSIGLGIYLSSVKNTGAAFGILQNNTLALGILSLLVSAFIILFLVRNRNKLNSISHFALALILAGAIGNMIDRLYLGFVRDLIHFKVGSVDFPFIFNIADSCVVVGAIILFLANLGPTKPVAIEAELPDATIQASGETHPVAKPDKANL